MRRSVEEPGNDENVARIFDRAADEVCVRCKNKNRCWNAEYVDTLSAMNDATQAMVEHGSLDVSDLPGFFRDRCDKLPAFVSAVNAELRAQAYRKQLRIGLTENRSVAWGQYMDMADVLSRVADELGSLNGSDPLAERRLIRYLRSMDIDADASVYRDGMSPSRAGGSRRCCGRRTILKSSPPSSGRVCAAARRQRGRSA